MRLKQAEKVADGFSLLSLKRRGSAGEVVRPQNGVKFFPIGCIGKDIISRIERQKLENQACQNQWSGEMVTMPVGTIVT